MSACYPAFPGAPRLAVASGLFVLYAACFARGLWIEGQATRGQSGVKMVTVSAAFLVTAAVVLYSCWP